MLVNHVIQKLAYLNEPQPRRRGRCQRVVSPHSSGATGSLSARVCCRLSTGGQAASGTHLTIQEV